MKKKKKDATYKVAKKKKNPSHCWLTTCYSCCSFGGQRGKAVDCCLQRKIIWGIIISSQLPRHMAHQWVVCCLQKFKGHKRALNPALKPAKQHHSMAKGTLGGQYREQPHEANHDKHSKQTESKICTGSQTDTSFSTVLGVSVKSSVAFFYFFILFFLHTCKTKVFHRCFFFYFERHFSLSYTL